MYQLLSECVAGSETKQGCDVVLKDQSEFLRYPSLIQEMNVPMFQDVCSMPSNVVRYKAYATDNGPARDPFFVYFGLDSLGPASCG